MNLYLYEKKKILLMLWGKMHFKEPLEYLVMQFQVATFVYDPFKPPPQQSQIYSSFAIQIRHVCVSDYLVHQSYICDVVGAHDVCFTIHLRATFRLRLFGARVPRFDTCAFLRLFGAPVVYLRCSWCTRRLLCDPFTSNVSFATVWCTRPLERTQQNDK